MSTWTKFVLPRRRIRRPTRSREKGLQHKPRASPSGPPTDNILPCDVSHPDPTHEQGQGETSDPDIQPQNRSPFSGISIHEDKDKEITITSILATDVTLGLRRIPVGFFVVLHHSDLEWRTENKPASVNHDVIEWTEPIPIPSDLSATVRLEVYASFELQPMLGTGEQLQDLTVTVKQLLNHSARGVPFTLSPQDRDIVSPCSSILVIVKQQNRGSGDSSALTVLDPHRSTINSLSELERATNHGHSALSRYREYGEKQDLDRSVEEFTRALSICPVNHPCRAAAQSNLAMVEFILCRVDGGNALLPLRLYLCALGARPVGQVDRPSTLIQLALVHFARFEKFGDEGEGTRAEALLREAMELSSRESHENRVAAFMLQLCGGRKVGAAEQDHDGRSPSEQDSIARLTDEDSHVLTARLLQRFERSGDLADLEQAIGVLQELEGSTSVWDVRYRTVLGSLGTALKYRFDHLGRLRDIEEAISVQRVAVDLTPHDHPDKPTMFNYLGSFFITRFKHFGELNDLEDAISVQRDALDVTPRGHPGKPSRLNGLGNSLFARFQLLGQLYDLEDTILMQRDAVDLMPHGHPHKPAVLNNLGNSLSARFKRLGQLSDLEEAISVQKDAVDFTPHGHPHKSGYLNNLGASFRTRFNCLGQMSDLEEAISKQTDAVELTPRGHPDKPVIVAELGTSFLTRFLRLNQLSDLDNAISKQKDAVDLSPPGHPDKPALLNSLGNSFLTRFECLGQLSDLGNAISALRDAIDLVPPGHPAEPVHLDNLGNSLLTRFKRLGQLSDLEEAILRLRNAVDHIPPDHPDKPAILTNLSNSFITRFLRLGQLSDLEDGISRNREAVELTPYSHLDKPIHLNNLGDSLLNRFQRLGQLSDLEDAISRLNDAVDLTPHGHPDKPTRLDNLGGSFLTRFMRLGELSDLEDAISRQRDAVDLTPRGHPDKPPRLNNLGNSLLNRFLRLGELSDFEDAISRHRDAIDLTPDGHPGMACNLHNLGISLFVSFKHFGHLSDLEEAISTGRAAVDLTPLGHPDMASRLYNLGNSFKARFEHFGNLSDLEDAVSRLKDAVDITPHGHPQKPVFLIDLGDFFVTRFEHLGQISDLECAISLYMHATSNPFSSIAVRFHASQKWVTSARRIRHHTLLYAYSVAIGLLPQLPWIGLPLARRYSELAQGADIVREAAATALELGLPETAVEWLEQGRSIIWGDLFQLRSSYDKLSSAHPGHARRLRELSAALDHASAIHERTLSALPEKTRSAPKSLQEDANKHRTLAIERDKLLQEIRKLPDFERFLLQKEFSQLLASAHSGPVVILNAAESRCDALIVLADVDHVIHVPLPDFTLKRSTGLQNTLNQFLRHTREGRPEPLDNISWESFLSPLWKCVVKPVLDALAFSTPGDLSRIFWCPTGPFMFLPIHAAGLYDTVSSELGDNVFDFVISSYTPSLSILAPSPNPSRNPSRNLHLLSVRQPPSDGLLPLPGVAIELRRIMAITKNSPCTTLLESSAGTVEEVLGLMKDADWVHFACHGVQDDENPTDSGLCLADERRLKISDIIALSRSRGGLAFLSACQTAKGDKNLSDEAIHIAAGMLFAGYGGVIGTMWSISDRLAPDVASDVYEELFRDGKRPDYREAARALHEAIGCARDRGESFFDWVPFIHVGL